MSRIKDRGYKISWKSLKYSEAYVENKKMADAIWSATIVDRKYISYIY